jgi:nucleoside phosphorylase
MELAPLVRKLRLVEDDIDGIRVQRGAIDARPVVAIVTGMGPPLAREGTTRLLDAIAIAHVMSVGITGALEDETPIGTLVLPEVVIDSATGREWTPAPVGEGSPAGKMWTTDGLTKNPEALAGLRARGVVALDMETAAIAECCSDRKVPWSVFRVISDRATDEQIDDEVFHMSNMDGTPNHEAIAAYFDKHPDAVERMSRLGEQATLAADLAADAAIAAVRTMD